MGHEKNKEESSQVNWWIAINQLSGKLDLICCLWCIDALNSAKCYTTWHCISSPSELIVNNTTSHLGGNQVYDSVGGEWWRLPTPQFLRSIPWLTNDTFIQPFSAVSVFVANSMPFIGTHFLANTGTESFCPQTQHHHQTNRCVAVYWQSNPSHHIARHHFPSNGSDSLSPTHTHTPHYPVPTPTPAWEGAPTPIIITNTSLLIGFTGFTVTILFLEFILLLTWEINFDIFKKIFVFWF